MKGTKKVILGSALAIALSASMIAGSTFALFTSESSVNIAVTSAKVNVSAKVDENSIEKSYDERLTGANEKFTASYEKGTLSLSEMAAGDSVSFNIVLTNESTIDVQYRTTLSVKDGFADGETKDGLFGELEVTFGGSAGHYDGSLLVSQWTKFVGDVVEEEETNTKTVPVTVTLPYESKAQNAACTLIFNVEAVQGNASVVKNVEVANLSDYFDGVDFSANVTTTGEKIVLDPVADGVNLIVTEWQDIWFADSLTIRNITFKQGLSVNNKTTNEKSLTIQDCTIYACQQENLRTKVENSAPTDVNVISNSGDGLCLGLDSAVEAKKELTVVIKGCHLVGDGGMDVERNGYKNKVSFVQNSRDKARGYGICLGASAGKFFAQSVLIDNCVLDNIRGNAIQASEITYPLTISNCKINSWGNNKLNRGATADTAEPKSDAAIRGDFVNGTLTLKNIYFGLDQENDITADRGCYHVNIGLNSKAVEGMVAVISEMRQAGSYYND